MRGRTLVAVSKDTGSILALLAAVATVMLCGHQNHSVEAFVTPLTTAPSRATATSSMQSNLLQHAAITTGATTIHKHNKIITSLTMMADVSDTPSIISTSSSYYKPTTNNNIIPRDVIIVGGGIAGLSIALRIATTSSRHVTIVEREAPRTSTTAGSSSSSNGPTTAG
eukprot:scaffold25721_cov80-Skeletonema_marinoi.AAC.1